jgi:hypothetical protein
MRARSIHLMASLLAAQAVACAEPEPAVLQAITVSPGWSTLSPVTRPRVHLVAGAGWDIGTLTDLPSEGLTWTSSDPAIATVDADGVVRADPEGFGLVEVTASARGVVSRPVLINVLEEDTFGRLEIGPAGKWLQPGDQVVLFGLLQADDELAVMQPLVDVTEEVTWTSQTPAIATVDDQGYVTAVSEGIAELTGTWSNHTQTLRITVTAQMPTSLSVEGPTSPIEACGGGADMIARARFADGSTRDVTDQVVWFGNDPWTVTMEGNRIRPVAGRNGTITALLDGPDESMAADEEIQISGGEVVGLALSSGAVEVGDRPTFAIGATAELYHRRHPAGRVEQLERVLPARRGGRRHPGGRCRDRRGDRPLPRGERDRHRHAGTTLTAYLDRGAGL